MPEPQEELACKRPMPKEEEEFEVERCDIAPPMPAEVIEPRMCRIRKAK